MQIASLFASLGFKVDDKGLDLFQSKLKSVRADTALFARNAKVLASNLRNMSASLDGVTSRLDKVGLKKANVNISDSYTEVAKSVARVHKALNGIANNQKRITQSLGKIHASIKVGTPMWDNYTASVLKAKDALTSVNGKIQQIRKNGSVAVRTTTTNTSINNNTGGFGFGGNRNNSPFGMGGNFGGGFFRAMLPAVATVGGLPTVGYAIKEIVQAGREMQKVQNTMRMNTQGQKDYAESMEFVRSESQRLGVSNVEFGKAYAKLRGDAGDVNPKKIQEVMTGFSEYMAVLGSTADDQKGVFRALGQMFTNVTVQGDELNQLAERGISKGLFKRVAMEVYGIKDADEYRKFQEAGKVESAKVLPRLAEELSKKARQGGALDIALKTSARGQERFFNTLREASDKIMQAGLDKALFHMFEAGTKLVSVLTDLLLGVIAAAKGLALLKKSMDDATGGNALLVAGLGGLLFVVLKNYKALIALWQVFRLFKAVGGLSAIFAGGVIGRALILAARFTLVGTAIYGLMKYAQALSDSEKGYTTWIDVYGMKLQLLYAKIENFILKTRVLWKEQGVSGILSGLKDILFPELYTDQMFKPKTKGNEQSLRGNPAPPKPVIPYKNQTTSVPTQPMMSAKSFHGTLDVNVNGEYKKTFEISDVGNNLAVINASV